MPGFASFWARIQTGSLGSPARDSLRWLSCREKTKRAQPKKTARGIHYLAARHHMNFRVWFGCVCAGCHLNIRLFVLSDRVNGATPSDCFRQTTRSACIMPIYHTSLISRNTKHSLFSAISFSSKLLMTPSDMSVLLQHLHNHRNCLLITLQFLYLCLQRAISSKPKHQALTLFFSCSESLLV